MSARRSGARRSISRIVCSHASRSNSGGGHGGITNPPPSDSHARRIARVERAGAVEIRDVVPGVAGCREACEPHDLVTDDVDVLGRNRGELAPELVERVAVEPARARLELRRIDDVRGPDLRDVHLQPGVLADERARGARVVEVDVREEKMPDVASARGHARGARPSGARRRSSGRSRRARARRPSRRRSSR